MSGRRRTCPWTNGRGAGRVVELCAGAIVLVLSACGGKTAHDADAAPSRGPEPASDETLGLPCLTSFSCGAGERCEASVCVPDVGCPALEPPRVVLELAGDDPETAYLHPVRIGGVEHFTSGTFTPAYELVIFDQDGRRTVLEDAGPGLHCGDDLSPCLREDDTEIVVLDDFYLEGRRWKAGTRGGVPRPSLIEDPHSGPYPDTLRLGTALFVGDSSVVELELATSEVTTLARFPARPVQLIATPAGGLLVAQSTEGDSGERLTIVEIARLELEPRWDVRAEIDAPGSLQFFIPSASGWYLVYDKAREYHVVRIEGAQQRTLGVSSAAAFGALGPYAWGLTPLEAERIAHVFRCDPDAPRCGLYRVDLETQQAAELASYDGELDAAGEPWTRELACGTKEVFLTETAWLRDDTGAVVTDEYGWNVVDRRRWVALRVSR